MYTPAEVVVSIPQVKTQISAMSNLYLERPIFKTKFQSSLPHGHHILHANFTDLVGFSPIHSIDNASCVTRVNLMLLQSKPDIKMTFEEIAGFRSCFQYCNLTVFNVRNSSEVNGDIWDSVV